MVIKRTYHVVLNNKIQQTIALATSLKKTLE